MNKKNEFKEPTSEAIEKRNRLITTAKDLIEQKDFFILDVEGTGFDKDDQIVEIGVLDPVTIEPLFQSLIRPTKGISIPATYAHGISDSDVAVAPTLQDVYQEFSHVLDAGKRIILYNADFLLKLFAQSRQPFALKPFAIETERTNVICAMEMFSAYVGEWLRWKPDFKWQRLPLAQHRAIPDCISILNVVRQVATDYIFAYESNVACEECGHFNEMHLDYWGKFFTCRQCGIFYNSKVLKPKRSAKSPVSKSGDTVRSYTNVIDLSEWRMRSKRT